MALTEAGAISLLHHEEKESPPPGFDPEGEASCASVTEEKAPAQVL